MKFSSLIIICALGVFFKSVQSLIALLSSIIKRHVWRILHNHLTSLHLNLIALCSVMGTLRSSRSRVQGSQVVEQGQYSSIHKLWKRSITHARLPFSHKAIYLINILACSHVTVTSCLHVFHPRPREIVFSCCDWSHLEQLTRNGGRPCVCVCASSNWAGELQRHFGCVRVSPSIST